MANKLNKFEIINQGTIEGTNTGKSTIEATAFVENYNDDGTAIENDTKQITVNNIVAWCKKYVLRIETDPGVKKITINCTSDQPGNNVNTIVIDRNADEKNKISPDYYDANNNSLTINNEDTDYLFDTDLKENDNMYSKLYGDTTKDSDGNIISVANQDTYKTIVDTIPVFYGDKITLTFYLKDGYTQDASNSTDGIAFENSTNTATVNFSITNDKYVTRYIFKTIPNAKTYILKVNYYDTTNAKTYVTQDISCIHSVICPDKDNTQDFSNYAKDVTATKTAKLEVNTYYDDIITAKFTTDDWHCLTEAANTSAEEKTEIKYIDRINNSNSLMSDNTITRNVYSKPKEFITHVYTNFSSVKDDIGVDCEHDFTQTFYADDNAAIWYNVPSISLASDDNEFTMYYNSTPVIVASGNETFKSNNTQLYIDSNRLSLYTYTNEEIQNITSETKRSRSEFNDKHMYYSVYAVPNKFNATIGLYGNENAFNKYLKADSSILFVTKSNTIKKFDTSVSNHSILSVVPDRVFTYDLNSEMSCYTNSYNSCINNQSIHYYDTISFTFDKLNDAYSYIVYFNACPKEKTEPFSIALSTPIKIVAVPNAQTINIEYTDDVTALSSLVSQVTRTVADGNLINIINNYDSGTTFGITKKNDDYTKTQTYSANTNNIKNSIIVTSDDNVEFTKQSLTNQTVEVYTGTTKSDIESNTNRSVNLTESVTITDIIKDTNVYVTYHNNIIANDKTVFSYLGNADLTSINVLVQRNADDNHTGYYYGLQRRTAEDLYTLKSTSNMNDISVITDIYNNDSLNISATLSNDNNHVLAIVKYKYDANNDRVIDNTLETVVGPLDDSGSVTKLATNLDITNYYYVLEARPREFTGVIFMSWAIGANAALAVSIYDYVTFNSITRTCNPLSSEPENFTTKQDIIISDDNGYNDKHAYITIQHLYYDDILEIDYSLKDAANYSIQMCDVTGQTAVGCYIVSDQFTPNVYFTNVDYYGYDFIKYCVVKPKKYNLTINANTDYFNIKSVVINHGSELWANWFALEYTAEAASKTFDISSSITHNNISKTTTYTNEVFYEDTIIIELQPATWCSFRDGMQSELNSDSKERLQIIYNTKTKEFTVKSNAVIDSTTNVMTISDTYTDITAEMSNYLTVTDNNIDSADLSSIIFNLIPGNVIYRNKYYVGLCKPDTVMATRIAITKSNTVTYNNNTITPVCASSSITRNNTLRYTLTDSDANNPTELTQLIQYIEYSDKLTVTISNATGNAPIITNSITDLGSFSRDDNLWYKYITADNGITLQSEVTLNGTAVPQILIKPNITAENLYTTTVYFNGGSVYDTPSDPILCYFEATVEYTNAYTINILGRDHDYLYCNIDTDDGADKFPSEILLAYIADSSDSNKKTTTMLYKFTNIYKDYSKIKLTVANTHDDYLDSDGEDIINNQYNVIPVTITHNDSNNTNVIDFTGSDADLYLFEYHIKRDTLVLPALANPDSYANETSIGTAEIGYNTSISTGISNAEYTILDGYEASEVKSECYIVNDNNGISNNETILDNKISVSKYGYSVDMYRSIQQSIHVYNADQEAITTVNGKDVVAARFLLYYLSGNIAIAVQDSKVLLLYNHDRIETLMSSNNNLGAYQYHILPFTLEINGEYYVTNRITLNQLTTAHIADGSTYKHFIPGDLDADDYYYTTDLTTYLNYNANRSIVALKNYNYIANAYDKSNMTSSGLLNSENYCDAIVLADLSKLNHSPQLAEYSYSPVKYDTTIKLLPMTDDYLIITIDGDMLGNIVDHASMYNKDYSSNVLRLEINTSPVYIGLSELKRLYYYNNEILKETSLFYPNTAAGAIDGDYIDDYLPYSNEFYKLKYDYEDDDFNVNIDDISGNSLEKDSAGNTNVYDAYYVDDSGDTKYDIYFNSSDSTLGDDPTVVGGNEYATQYVLLIMPLDAGIGFSFSRLSLDNINTVGVDNNVTCKMQAKTAATVKFDVNNTIKTYNVTTSGISISYNEYYYIQKILSSLTTSTIDTVNLTSKTTKYEISVNKVTISTNDTSTDACYTTASINDMNLHTLYIPVSSTLSATYTLNDTYAIINPTSLPGTSDITVFDINNKQTTVNISNYYKTEYSNKDRGITGTTIVYCSRTLDAANNKYMFKPAAIRYYYTNFIGQMYDTAFNTSDINWSFSTNDRKTWVSTMTSNNDAIASADKYGLSCYSGSPMYVANIYCYKYSNGKIYIKVGDKLFVSCSPNASDGYFCVPSLISYSYEFTNDAVKGTTLTNVPYIGMQITSSAQLGSNLGTSIIDANNRSIVANFIAKPDDSSAPCYFASTITNDSVDSYTLGFVDTSKFYLGSDVYTESDKKYYWTYAALTMSTKYVTSISDYCKYYVTTNENDSNIKGYKIVHDSNSALFNAALLEYNTKSDDTSDYFVRLVNIQFHTVDNNYIRSSSITNSGGYYLLHGSNSSISNLTNYDNVSRLGIEYDDSDAAKQKNNIYHRDNVTLANVFNKYMSNHVAILSMMYFGNNDAYSQCLYNIGEDDNGNIAYVNSYTKTLCTIYRPKSELVSINYIIDDYDYSSSVFKINEIEEEIKED